MKILYAGMFPIRDQFADVRAGKCPSHTLHMIPDLLDRGHEVDFFDSGDYPGARRIEFQRRLLTRLKMGCELLIAHNLVEINWIALLRRAGLLDIPIAAFVHSVSPRSLQRISAKGVDLLLTISHEAHRIMESVAARGAALKYFGFGADIDFYPPPEPPGEIVLSVGVSGRDFDVLIDAAAHIAAEIVIVGRVSNAQRSRAGRNVRFLSSGNYDLSYKNLIALYQRAAVVVVSHHGTPHPFGNNALVEAMAMARPVVMTRSLGIDIHPGEAGFGVDIAPHDPESLAGAVNMILSDPERLARMGNVARSLAESRYNAKVISTELDAWIRSSVRPAIPR